MGFTKSLPKSDGPSNKNTPSKIVNSNGDSFFENGRNRKHESQSHDSLSARLSSMLELDEDQAQFLHSYEQNYGGKALMMRVKQSINWSEMKSYPDLETNPDPTK